MYTRNYRIQHSERRTETPRDEERLSDANENGGIGGALMDESAEVGSSEEKTDNVDTVLEPERAEESVFSEEPSKETGSAPRKRRAVRYYRFRSSVDSQPDAAESEKAAESESETETRKDAKFAERLVTEREERSETPRAEAAQMRHFVGRQERSFERKPLGFGANPFGIKNFSPEDIFLAAILLLLLNEGCEDIMTLILGFLLIS